MILMSKKNKLKKEERIPEGMSRKDYADAAFRKKVTIIMGSILLVFTVGICAVLFFAWLDTEQKNKEFDRLAEIFNAEKTAVITELREIEAKSDNFDDKAQVKIEVTDDNFVDWVGALDASYQAKYEDESYAQFGGATIHLQGMFYTKTFENSNNVQYWVYRNHTHGDEEHHHHDGEVSIGEMIPIEVVFPDDAEAEIPKDGTWVDVTGIVGPDTTKNLSAVRFAEMKLLDEPGQEYVK